MQRRVQVINKLSHLHGKAMELADSQFSYVDIDIGARQLRFVLTTWQQNLAPDLDILQNTLVRLKDIHGDYYAHSEHHDTGFKEKQAVLMALRAWWLKYAGTQPNKCDTRELMIDAARYFDEGDPEKKDDDFFEWRKLLSECEDAAREACEAVCEYADGMF
jgi:hypothetical protein